MEKKVGEEVDLPTSDEHFQQQQMETDEEGEEIGFLSVDEGDTRPRSASFVYPEKIGDKPLFKTRSEFYRAEVPIPSKSQIMANVARSKASENGVNNLESSELKLEELDITQVTLNLKQEMSSSKKRLDEALATSSNTLKQVSKATFQPPQAAPSKQHHVIRKKSVKVSSWRFPIRTILLVCFAAVALYLFYQWLFPSTLETESPTQSTVSSETTTPSLPPVNNPPPKYTMHKIQPSKEEMQVVIIHGSH